MIENHPHRAGADLGRKLVRRPACHGSTFSGVGASGKPGAVHFPNAEYFITQADYDFWTDETKVPSEFKVFLETARKNLSPNKDRMHFIKDGEEILPGVHAILAPGHTVGHTVFMINSGKESLCYVGDLAHHPVI
ncbi:MAG: hypothetical protein WCF49_18635, partial [Xanthobacteraceae bacterium]